MSSAFLYHSSGCDVTSVSCGIYKVVNIGHAREAASDTVIIIYKLRKYYILFR